MRRLDERSFMMALTRSLMDIVSTNKKGSKNDLSIQEYWIYTNPVQIPNTDKFVSIVMNANLETKTIIPSIEVTDSKEEFLAAIKQKDEYNSRVSVVGEQMLESLTSAQYVGYSRGSYSGNMANSSNPSPLAVMAEIIGRNLDIVYDYIIKCVEKNRRLDIYNGQGQISKECYHNDRTYEFDNTVNIVVDKVSVYDRTIDVDFSISLNLESLRASKNDGLFD